MTTFERASEAFGGGAPIGAAFGVATTPLGTRTLLPKEARHIGRIFAETENPSPVVARDGLALARQRNQIKAANMGDTPPDPVAEAWRKGASFVGQSVQRNVSAVSSALDTLYEHTVEPTLDYVEAAHRFNEDQTRRFQEGTHGTSALDTFASTVGVVAGAPFLYEEFRERYWDPAREATEQGYGASAAQTAWELSNQDLHGNVWNPQTGRFELPLIDDPEKWAERQEYFNHGQQRWNTGVADAILNVALDPTVLAGAAVSKGAQAVRSVSAADVAGAAQAGRGVQAARRARELDPEDGVEDAVNFLRNQGDEAAPVAGDAAALSDEAAMDAADRAIPSVEETFGSKRVKRNIERLTDVMDEKFRGVREGGESGAGIRAQVMKDPLIQRMGPEKGLIVDAAAWVSSTFSDDIIRKGVMDDVWLGAMGDRTALRRLEDVNERMALDLQAMVTPDGKAVREAIDANPYMTTAEKWDASNNDTLWLKQKRLIEEDVAGWQTSAQNRLGQVINEGRGGLDEVGATGLDVMNVTEIPLTTGFRRRIQTSRFINSFQSLPPVQVLSGTHVPHTLDLNDTQAVELFDKHVRTSLSLLGRRAEKEWGDEIRDAFAVTRGELAEGTSRGQRADVLQKFERTMADNLASKIARSKKARQQGWDKKEIREWINLARRQWADDVDSAQKHMRQAVQKGERVGITPDGQPFAMDASLTRAISQGQFDQSMPLMDWGRMEKQLKKHFTPGELTEPGESLLALTKSMGTTALTEFTNAWKFAVLLRPVAYPMRVQQDTQLRNLATMGVMEASLMGLRGTRNFMMNNLQRVDRGTYRTWERKTAAEQDFIVANDALAPYLRPDGSLASDAPEAAQTYLQMRDRALRIRNMGTDDFRDIAIRAEEIDEEIASLAARRQEVSRALAEADDDALMLERTELNAQIKALRAEKQSAGEDLGGLTTDELFALGTIRRGKAAGFKKIQGSSQSMNRKTGEWEALPNQLDTYIHGDRDMRAALMPNARQHTYNLLAQSGDNLADRLRRAKEDMGWHHLDYGVGDPAHKRWNTAVADQINKHIRNDSSLMRMAVGADDGAIVNWMRTTPAGREYWQTHRLTRDGDPIWDNEWQLVNAQRAHFDAIIPDGKAAGQVVARDVTADDVAYWWGEGDTRPLVPENLTKKIELSGRERIAQAYDTTRSRYFELMSTLPEVYMGRHPQYNRFFQQHMGRIMKSTNKENYSQVDINRMRQRARISARKDMQRIMFDTSHRSEIAHKMRFVAPFFSAWEDVMVKWSRIIAQRPEVAPLLMKGLNAPRSAFVVQDDDGNRILANGDVWRQDEDGNLVEKIGTEHNPNAGHIVIRMPSWLQNFSGGDHFKLSRGSLNATFQGEVPFLPGLGPVATIPVNEFMAGKIPGTRDFGPLAADEAKFEIPGVGTVDLVQYVQPFGQTDRSILEQAAPTYLTNMIETVRNDSRRAQAVKQQMMNEQIIKEELGQTPRLGTDERMEMISQKSRNWWLLRFMGSQLPVSSRPGTELDFYMNEYRRYMDEDPATGEERFIEDYPDYFLLTTSTSLNETGIQATQEAHTEEKKWRRQVAAYPKVGWALVGPEANEGEFSMPVYINQLSEPIHAGVSDLKGRRARTDDEIRVGAAVEAGWKEYNQISKQIDLRLEELGLTSLQAAGAANLRQVKDDFKADLMARNPEWAHEFNAGFEVGSNPVAEFLDGIVASMQSNPEATAQTPHLEVVQEYVMLRDTVRTKMLEAGYESTGDSPTSEFRQTELYKVWMDAVEDMKRRSSTFSEIYTRARLEQDNLASDPLAAYREGGE